MFKKMNVVILPAVVLLLCLSVYAQRSSSQRQRQEAQPSIAADNGNSFTDPRDGQTYRTVRIGNNTWMAQNLNYMAIDMSCYDNDPSNCAKYGFLYTWDAAMMSCPAGWRLPTREDWNGLVESAGGISVAGTKLKSITGWIPFEDTLILGTDDFGFSAMPGGLRYPNGVFWAVGMIGFWWSATEDDTGSAWGRNTNSGSESMFSSRILKGDALSVRCVQ